MQELDIVLREVLKKEEITVIKIYNFLNQEILHRNYEVTEKELEAIIKFFENKDEKIFESVWSSQSLQKEIFRTSLLIVENLKNYNFDREKIEKGVYNEENQFLKVTIKNNIDYLIDLGKSLNGNRKKPLMVKKNYFSIYKIEHYDENMVVDIEKSNKYIYIMAKGNVKCGNKIYLEKSVFYSDTFKNFSRIGNGEFTIFLISLTREFFEINNIELSTRIEERSYFISDVNILKVLNKVFNNNCTDPEKEKILIQEMIYYFIDTLNGFKYNLINMKELEMKKQIMDTIVNNIEEKDKLITEKLLDTIGVSISKLYKLFDDLYEETPGNYIKNVKLKKVYRDLTLANVDVEDISYSIGYSYKYLTKLIMEETGYRLNELRKYLRRK